MADLADDARAPPLLPAAAPAGWRDPAAALGVLAVIAILGLLYLGRAFFIPVVASITLAAVLDPVRRRLTRALRSGVLAS